MKLKDKLQQLIDEREAIINIKLVPIECEIDKLYRYIAAEPLGITPTQCDVLTAIHEREVWRELNEQAIVELLESGLILSDENVMMKYRLTNTGMKSIMTINANKQIH